MGKVTEETGGITIADNGVIMRDLTGDDLRAMLHTGIFGDDTDENSEKKSVVSKIRENLKWKIKK